jgi:two-component system, NarL family, response regulator LiaR
MAVQTVELPRDEAPRAVRSIKVAIVERQRLVGDALEALLTKEPDIDVVGIFDYASERGTQAAVLRPDILVMDFCINAQLVADMAREIRDAGCSAPIIALTRTEDDGVLVAAIEAGSTAIVYEREAGASMIKAVRRAADGMTLIPPGSVAAMLQRRRFRHAVTLRLTRREREILSLLARGTASRDIALTLGISYLTVRTHVRNLAAKLGVHGKLEIIARAHDLDLIVETRLGAWQPIGRS